MLGRAHLGVTRRAKARTRGDDNLSDMPAKNLMRRKLKQIHDRYNIIREGDAILDVGCHPGGWSQVAVEASGERGLVRSRFVALYTS